MVKIPAAVALKYEVPDTAALEAGLLLAETPPPDVSPDPTPLRVSIEALTDPALPGALEVLVLVGLLPVEPLPLDG